MMSKEAVNKHMGLHGGSIVNIVACVDNGFPGMSHTGAARAGVINLTKSMATELAHCGVRINSVSPGIIYSESAAKNYEDPNLLLSNAAKIPFKRLGTVEEVSSAVTFLASPASSYVTGTNFTVDGGLTMAGTLWKVPSHETQPPFAGDASTLRPDEEDVENPISKMSHLVDFSHLGNSAHRGK